MKKTSKKIRKKQKKVVSLQSTVKVMAPTWNARLTPKNYNWRWDTLEDM